MKKKGFVIAVGIWISLLLTGCWDRKELNDLAIWLATGIDAGENGGIEISGQITIPQAPSQGGGSETGSPSFFTISAKGTNIEDALQNLQTKLPREAFYGQRRVIFLGEALARRGLRNELDLFSRDPQASLRSDIFVIMGGTAKEALALTNPLEKYPAVAALKEHRESGGKGDTAYMDFLMAANRDGIRPTIPAVEITRTVEGGGAGSDRVLRLSGVAVFDRNLQMRGCLNTEEKRHFLWIRGILNKMAISLPRSEGNFSIKLTKITSKIKPRFDWNDRVRFEVLLEAEAMLLENNTGTDMMQKHHLQDLEKKFEKEAEGGVQRTVEKVQTEFGTDIFGFGEVVKRKHPVRWKTMKDGWDQTFRDTDITVKADIKIKHIGMGGSSLLSEESEGRK